MDLLRLRLYPLSIEVVFTLLGNLADIDLGIKVRSKCLVMVPSVAVYNIEVVDLVEVMLGGIGGKDARHPGVETTSKDSGKAGLFESFAIGPLPAILILCLVKRLIIGGIKVVYSALQAGIHNGKVLVGKSYIYHKVGLKAAE